jgi:hypothetical protein
VGNALRSFGSSPGAFSEDVMPMFFVIDGGFEQFTTCAFGDGTRILVDRLWPRGLALDEAHIDAWVKGVASTFPGTAPGTVTG